MPSGLLEAARARAGGVPFPASAARTLPSLRRDPLVRNIKPVMFVGVLRLTLTIPGSRSLKDKRRVTLSLKERLQARFHVSAAEVSSLDNHRVAEIGVAVVSNEAAHCDRVMAEVVSLASTHADAVLADRRSEIVPFGEGGKGLSRGIESFDLDDEATSMGGEDEDATWCGDEGDDGKGPR